jgi:hypothetical protein
MTSPRATVAALALIVSAATPSSLAAQGNCSGHTGDWLSLDQFDLVQTLDKKLVAAPASFSYTRSAGDSTDSRAINAALRYNLPLNERYSIGPSVEYASNTLSKKKQDQVKVGITGDVFLICSLDRWVPYLSFGIERADDKVKKTRGWIHQAQVTLSPPATAGFLKYLSNQAFPISTVASVVLTPYVGMEYQTTDSARIDKSVLRAKGSYSANVMPFPHTLKQRLTIVATQEVRRDLSRKGIATPEQSHWLVLSADYVLLSEKSPSGEKHTAGIGLTYRKGSNPAEGFAQQEVTQFVFKIQY